MFNFAANLGFIFPQCPFLDRFSAAARAGFQRCEFLFPYYFKPEDLGTKLSASELMQALFNLPPGNWDARRGGLAALLGREAVFAASIERALRCASPKTLTSLLCKAINMQ